MFINSLKNGAFQILEDSQRVSKSYISVHLKLVIGGNNVDLAQESLSAPCTCAPGKEGAFLCHR